jgi:aspartate 1-decarboxylase
MSRRPTTAIVVAVALSLGVVGCGSNDTLPASPSSSAPSANAQAAISQDEVIGALDDGEIVRIDAHTGRATATLGRVPWATGAEIDSVDVAPDGNQVLVSVQNDHDQACAATVYAFDPQNGKRTIFAHGAAASYSPSGAEVAYISYRQQDDEFCRRSQLVTRTSATGHESAFSLPGGETLEGNPPEWPLNWSPDGSRLVFVAQQGAVVVSAHHSSKPSPVQTADPQNRVLSPIFLDDQTIAGLTDCCVGTGHVRAFTLGNGDSRALFDAAAIRGIRLDRGGSGLWLTIEEQGLWHWDGSRLVQKAPNVLMTSG